MSTVIGTGGQIEKSPRAVKMLLSNFDSILPVGSQLVDVGTFTITMVTPNMTDPTPITMDEISMAGGSRGVKFRVSGGAEDRVYRITHFVTSNEIPVQKHERSFYIWVHLL